MSARNAARARTPVAARARPRGAHRLLALCLVLLATPLAHADWRRDYTFGQQAYEKGQWSEAEKLMRSAMAEEPGASARKRLQGTRFELYAPAHVAGMAAFRQGACDRALQYFADAATREVAAQVASVGAEQQEVQRSCGGQVAATPVPKPPVAETPVTRPPPTPTPEVRAPVAEAKPPVAEPPKPAPTPVQVPEAAPAVRTAAPAALRSILTKFLAGDYEAALAVSDAGIGDARGRAMLLLVRSAAGYTLAEIKGSDAALVARADRDAQASRRLQRIDPDPNLFSPKVRARIAKIR